MGMKPLNFLFFLLFLAGVTWALTRSPQTVRSMQAGYYRAISPFLTANSDLDLHARKFLGEAEHSKALQAEVDAMQAEFGRLRLIEEQYQTVEEENHELRRALGFARRTRLQIVPARVTRRQSDTWWQTIEIDRGEKAGLATACPVITDHGLVGKIDRLGDDFSTVILLTDEACQVSAKIEGTADMGILQGERGQPHGTPMLRLRFLPPHVRLQAGARVFSSGRGGVFPPDMLMGEVVQIEPGPLSTEALVRPAVDFQNLATVFVVISGGKDS